MAATNKVIRFFDLRSDARDGKIPHFSESIPLPGGGYKHEKFNSLSGILVDAFLEEKTFKDEPPYRAFKLILQDGSETIRLEMKPVESAFSILSRLGNSKPGIPVEIEVRRGTNSAGRDFAKAMVLQNNQPLDWYVDLTQEVDGDRYEYFEDYFNEVIKPLCV